MARIGLIDVDGHSRFPNFALMRISAYHKAKGDTVEWADPLFGGHYDKIYRSKVFTFTPDDNNFYDTDCEERGGTGYDIEKKLPKEIEQSTLMDYSIYPDCNYSIQFFSRGCIRKCPFCLVNKKEGHIHPVTPVQINPNSQWIEIIDNNFFANPQWKQAAETILSYDKPVKFHGVDIRIMDEEQAQFLNKLKHKGNIHIAWDLPQADLTQQLQTMAKYVKPSKITCYVLIGFNSTKVQDYKRVHILKSLGILPFVQPYRDFENKRTPELYEHDFAQWANQRMTLHAFDFPNFNPRKNFSCHQHYSKQELQEMEEFKKLLSENIIKYK